MKKAVVAGATGSVGRLIVRTLLGDPRVSCVMAVVRAEVPADRAAEIWGERAATPPPTGGGDGGGGGGGGGEGAARLRQIVVDYAALAREAGGAGVGGGETTAKVKESLAAGGGCDAFLTALGVYSSNASEKEMDEVEGSYNSALAAVVRDLGASRGAYLSGEGVKQPLLEGTAWSKFARAKGRAEEGLASLFGEKEGGCHVSCRPAVILERPGPPVYGFMDGTLMKMWPFKELKDTKFGITAADIAKGMVQGALFDDETKVKGNTIWENTTLKDAARRYEANCPGKCE